MKSLVTLFLIYLFACQASAQTVRPDLHSPDIWNVTNRKTEIITESGKKVLRVNEAVNDGLVTLKDHSFVNGTIEFDVKGRNVLQKSFVGVAFHVQDAKHYEVVYFRPFNFMNPDTARRLRAVQYVSMPDYPWEKLRADTPGKYEKRVNPVPDAEDWFHAKIIVNGKSVKVFVNNATDPCLEVERLGTLASGNIALWTGNSSNGSFANLEITPARE
ncbi:family 16 glycoside hydrolase [Dyadobacter pollutisoli]|uniref:3-keto-alpha-glucoside-1,2-lyase/3-keto-2-hydroxy-glucal hydratase domain-containing protein n=1 Tax=Dyadobacter pollutisoli TaxID=2910158 RepID=A0A9E8NHW7_9BACT|nr:family 16 glycoside hydrolase [Dyadobacter pollutisoli]WAC15307.1 hypothetical protein ON006_15340 [Dyadobacter pollutisoli]